MEKRKKFVMSFSCGKDSTLALHKMIQQGHEPVALIVMINAKLNRSYFHGADEAMLKKIEQALNIPVLRASTTGEDYHLVMEQALREAQQMGAEVACFGDIDIEENRAWSEDRCKNVGVRADFPLWNHDRTENVQELINLGYRCLIKTVNNTMLPKSLLGQTMDAGVVKVMQERGIDVCGENGEYHTMVVDGPIFSHPIAYQLGSVLDFGNYSVIEID